MLLLLLGQVWASWLAGLKRVYESVIKDRFYTKPNRSELHKRAVDYGPTSTLPFIAHDTVWWMCLVGFDPCNGSALKLGRLERWATVETSDGRCSQGRGNTCDPSLAKKGRKLMARAASAVNLVTTRGPGATSSVSLVATRRSGVESLASLVSNRISTSSTQTNIVCESNDASSTRLTVLARGSVYFKICSDYI